MDAWKTLFLNFLFLEGDCILSRSQCTVNSIETQGKYAPAIENAAKDKASQAA